MPAEPITRKPATIAGAPETIIRALTEEERATWGQCPICHAARFMKAPMKIELRPVL